jgi:hypothetical protein
MYEENDGLFQDFEIDTNDLPKYISYVTYRALSCYYANKYDEASKWINNLLNDLSLKRFPQAQLEVKLLLALQYCLLNDYELFSQLLNSIQRQIRILGKDNCERMLLFTKILKTSLYDSKNGKAAKIRSLVEKLAKTHEKGFSITNYIKMDEGFINRLTS